MTTPIVVRGKAITPAIIHAFARRLNSTDDIVTQWANGAVLELVKNQNGNWLYEMFDCRAFRLANGALNKLGQEVFSYVQAHYPRLTHDKETNKIGLKKYNPESPLAENFVSVGDSEIVNDPLLPKVIEINGKFYRPHGDFALTFAEYKLFKAQKSSEPPADKPVLAKSISKAVEKALEAQADSRFIGAPDELVSAMEALGKLANGIREQLRNFKQGEIDSALAKVEEAKAIVEPSVITLALALTDDEKALSEANSEIQRLRDEVNALKAKKPSSRAARNKAAQAIAETALTQEIKDKAASADAVQPQAKDAA